MYKIIDNDTVCFVNDEGVSTFFTKESAEWQGYQAWLAEGNEPDQPPAESAESIQARLTAYMQRMMDAEARTRGYDSILSLCTYATSTNPQFQAEGQAGVVWRDQCWALGYQLMDEVKAGSRLIPTEAELFEMLPDMVWPPAA